MTVSQKLRAALKSSQMKSYEIANSVGLDPSPMSSLICGNARPKTGDCRVVEIERVLGIAPKGYFEDDELLAAQVASCVKGVEL